MSLQAGLLVRISDDSTGEGLGVERQEQDCRALAERHGWTVAKVYRENDTSAFARKKVRLPDGTTALRVVRPAFRELLDDIAAQRITALVAYDLDRVARDPRDLEDLIDAVEATHTPAVGVTGGIDLATDSGITMARVQVAIANKASRDTSRRVRRAMLALAENGGVHGGSRPFGYEADRVTVRPGEAEHVRWAHQQIAEGRSLRSIGVDLARHYPDRRWDADGVRRILTSPRYAALRVHQGTVVGPGRWSAIVTVEEWERTCALLTDREHPSRKVGGPRRYLLTGLLTCGRCGERLYPRRNADRQRFGCLASAAGGCGGSLILYEPAEQFVLNLTLDRLRQAQLPTPEPEDTTAGIRLEIARVEQEQRDLGAALGDDPSLLLIKRSAMTRLTERLDTLRRQLAEQHRHRTFMPEQVLTDWHGYDLDQRRLVLDTLIDKVIVASGSNNGPRFDERRLHVVWR